MPKKSTILFFCIVALSFILMTYQSKHSRLVTTPFFSDLLNRLSLASGSLTDAITGPFERMALREAENVKLKERLDRLLAKQGNYQEVVRENKRLRGLLALRERRDNFVAAAEAIGRGSGRWSRTLVIDKGLGDGVDKDMTVITPLGLAGKIAIASTGYSTVLLITDITFSAAVRLQESRREAILSGTGSKRCALKYMPRDAEVEIGDVVVTSGLDSLFPPGIPVGYVSGLDGSRAGGGFRNVEVVPFQDDEKIEEVVIVR
jgi:rod shape-determining protein MreC